MGGVKRQGPLPIWRIMITFIILTFLCYIIIWYFGISLHFAVFLMGFNFPMYIAAGYFFTRNRHREIRRFWFGITLFVMIMLGVIITIWDDYRTGLKIAPDLPSFLISESFLIFIITVMGIDLYRRKELRKVFHYGS